MRKRWNVVVAINAFRIRTTAAAEDFYSAERSWGRTDDGTVWSSADKSEERSVSFPPTCRNQIFKLFINVSTWERKVKNQAEYLFLVFLKKIKRRKRKCFLVFLLSILNQKTNEHTTRSVYHLIISFPVWNGITRNEKTDRLFGVSFSLINGKWDFGSISNFSFVVYKSVYGFDISFAHVGGAETPLSSDWSNRFVFSTARIRVRTAHSHPTLTPCEQ